MTDDIDIGEVEKLYLPWHHNDNGLVTGTPEDSNAEDYPCIADLAQEPGIEGTGDKFRADFIVLACNAHHDMLSALESILKWWLTTPGFQDGDDDMPAALFDGMRDAIAKARGQQ